MPNLKRRLHQFSFLVFSGIAIGLAGTQSPYAALIVGSVLIAGYSLVVLINEDKESK